MLIIHAHLFPMDQDPIPDGFLAWENGVITSIGPMKLCPPMLENTIDLKGASLMPGLIDAHCHIGICGDGGGIENEDINEETDPVTPHLRAIDAVNPFDRCFEEAVAAGVTTVLTGPGSANPIAGEFCALKTWGETIEDRIIAAPVGMKFSLGENPKMTYSGKNQTPITRMATAALIREQLMKARRYQKDKARAAEDDELDEPELDLKCEALIPALNRKIKAFFRFPNVLEDTVQGIFLLLPPFDKLHLTAAHHAGEIPAITAWVFRCSPDKSTVAVHLEIYIRVFFQDSYFPPLAGAVQIEDQAILSSVKAEIKRYHIWFSLINHCHMDYPAFLHNQKNIFQISYFPVFSSHLPVLHFTL